MDVGLDGLSLEHESLSGIPGETVRPVFEDGQEVMEGFETLRGTVDDYRVSGLQGTDVALPNKPYVYAIRRVPPYLDCASVSMHVMKDLPVWLRAPTGTRYSCKRRSRVPPSTCVLSRQHQCKHYICTFLK